MEALKTLAEGGQTWAHRVRMVKQVLKITLGYAILPVLIYMAFALYRTNPTHIQSGYYHLKGLLLSTFKEETTVPKGYWQRLTQGNSSGPTKTVSIKRLHHLTTPHIKILRIRSIKIVRSGSLFFGINFGSILLFFLIRGTTSKRKMYVSGKKRVRPEKLALELKLKGQASPIKLGILPLVKGTETQHILVTGGTGSGKTNCFHTLLPQIKQQNHKAVIIDTTGAFVDKYYNAKTDSILNPFDERGEPWHPWVECIDQFDYESLAESFIPITYHDNDSYWRTAARTLLIAVLQNTKDLQKTSELARWLLYEPLDNLANFVQETRAAAHIDPNSERTAASIRSVASSFLTCLEYIKDTTTPFSIREWVKNSQEGSWLFLSCKPSQRSALTPLLSCWFSIAARSLNQMDPDYDRRMWFIIDELPTLQKLKDLETFVTESRKYGGCGLLALQSPAQLEEIYGRASARTIMGNCGTRVIFAEHDANISKAISQSLGESEIKEYQEGISYGAHEIRDGVSLSLQTKHRPIVSPTDIQSLEPNQAFIRLPGNRPITQIKLRF